MIPGARLQAAIELADEIFGGDLAPELVVERYFRKRRYAGSSDRRNITSRLYDLLRRRARLGWWAKQSLKGQSLEKDAKIDTRTLLIADLALSENLSSDEAAVMFSGPPHAPEPLTEQEQGLIDGLSTQSLDGYEDMPAHVRLEYPEWLSETFTALWGDNLNAEMSALNQVAPVDLRVNTASTTVGKVLNSLAQREIKRRNSPLSPIGIRLDEHKRLGNTDAHKYGWIEIQDEGSQLVSLLAGARPEMTVIDYCAGAGGKTLAMAAAMSVKGRVVGKLTACDISPTRLKQLTPRLRRAFPEGAPKKGEKQFEKIPSKKSGYKPGKQTEATGAEKPAYKLIKSYHLEVTEDPWVIGNQGTADRVFVDAPCSGTGSWRRNPVARWNLTKERLEELCAIQRDVLGKAAGLVKTGGRLIYVTCSVLAQENEEQMQWFKENHPEFKALPIEQVWAENIDAPCPADAVSGVDSEYLRLTPATTNTDGFFCTVLERVS